MDSFGMQAYQNNCFRRTTQLYLRMLSVQLKELRQLIRISRRWRHTYMSWTPQASVWRLNQSLLKIKNTFKKKPSLRGSGVMWHPWAQGRCVWVSGCKKRGHLARVCWSKLKTSLLYQGINLKKLVRRKRTSQMISCNPFPLTQWSKAKTLDYHPFRYILN